MKTSELFNMELNYISNDTLRKIVSETLDASPKCIQIIPASSSKRYHPEYATIDGKFNNDGTVYEGGLMRHIKAAVGIAHCMIENDIFTNMVMSKEDKEAEDFTEKRQAYSDIAYASLILHDCKKPDDTPKHSTRFDHPLLAAKLFKEVAKNYITQDNMGYMQFVITGIYRCIASHMGQYCTAPYAKGVVLPKPNSGIEHFVHIADYLASRRFLTFEFDKYDYNSRG